MLQHLVYACGLVLATTFIHAGCTAAVLGWSRALGRTHWALRNNATRAAVLSTLVLGMTFAAWLEAAVWATAYWWLEALPDFSEALYFSLVTFTTLGYGDVTLSDQWRMLSALEAANGTMMFGWTTALVVAAAQRLYSPHEPPAGDA